MSQETVTPSFRRHALSGVLAVGGLVVAVFIGAWLFDEFTRGDEVGGEVAVGGRSVGNLTPEEVDSVLEEIETERLGQPITITAGNEAMTTTPAELGIALDKDAARAEVLAKGGGSDLLRPVDWAVRRVESRRVDLAWTLDEAVAEAELAPFAERIESDPIEPTIEPGAGTVNFTAGTPGGSLDRTKVTNAVLNLVRDKRPTRTVQVALDPIAPETPDDEIEALTSDFNSLTEGDLTVNVGDASHTITARSLRASARLDPATQQLVLDEESALELLAARFADDADPGEPASFEPVDIPVESAAPVTTLPPAGTAGSTGAPASTTPPSSDPEDGTPESSAPDTPAPAPAPKPIPGTDEIDPNIIPTVRVIPSVDGTKCCAGPVSGAVLDGLASSNRTVDLEWIATPPEHDTEWAESLNIVEPIGKFTTFHAAGQSRVHNIHTMADVVRGFVIEPGEMLSLNDHVGMRTREKGYKSAGVIYNGEFTEDTGGGVSQFSTTLFNAAFFAGLDFGEYQSHSRIISRYPYGRETTLSFPAPDLQIINNTPDGILVWPTYTDGSITVTLYGTPFAVGEQSSQYRGFTGSWCRVSTERTRTFLDDGRTETDTIKADYRDRC